MDLSTKRISNQAEIAAFNKRELHDYRESQKDFWDLNSVIETAEKKGMKKGIKEGIKKGRAEGRAEGEAIGMQKGEHNKALDIARNLKSFGMPINQIIAMTGLSEDDINAL